jgi:oligopeptide/dipeptide ABC transporter ATP-binding protein
MARQYKLLEVENLNTSFKIDAGKVLSVNGVSFTLEKGKVLGIVGESGSGKSVTAYSIMGILDKNGKVDGGKIIYNGTDLLRISERQMRDIRGNRISIIFQDAMTSLNPTWTIGNQLREAILTHARNPIEAAVYDIRNAIESDEQRLASMRKGIAHHPDSQKLKDDYATIEKKLADDKAAFEVEYKKATERYKVMKEEAREKYKAALPQFKAIYEGFKNDQYDTNIPHFDEEVVDEAKKLKKNIEKANDDYPIKLDKYNQALASLNEYQQSLKAAKKDVKKEPKAKDEKLLKLKFEVSEAKAELKKAKKAVSKSKRLFRKHARKAKKWYYWECISEYKETKYSANKKALKMLEEVGITEPKKRMKQHPFEMSGGMLQRAMIAMALVERPDILIADEPTTALDVTIQAQILELLKKLQKEYGMAIIIITHDLGVVAQICDEVDIMYAGRIVERGTVDDIFYNPQHEYTKGLLNSMPKLDSKGKRLEPIQGNPVDLFCLPKGCAFSSRCKECMEICIERYPEEVQYDEKGHAASCWKMIKKLYEEGKIDIVNGVPEGKPLKYNGAIIANKKKERSKNEQRK